MSEYKVEIRTLEMEIPFIHLRMHTKVSQKCFISNPKSFILLPSSAILILLSLKISRFFKEGGFNILLFIGLGVGGSDYFQLKY